MNKSDREFLAQKIRTQYMEKQSTELDELRRLDGRVKRPANVFGYVFGILGAIVLGAGMSLIMTELSVILGAKQEMAMTFGIVIGVLGAVLASLAFPAYNAIIKAKRKKLTPEIIRLADELMK